MSSAVSRPRSLGPIEAPGRASVPAIFPGEERAPCRPRFRHSEHCPPEKEPRPALPPSSASCAPLPAEERARLPFQEDVGMNLSHHAPERAPSSPEARGGAKGKRLLGAGTRDSRCQGLGGGFEGTRSSLCGEICHVSSDTGAKISPRSGASFHRPHKARRGGSVWVLGGFRDRCWTVAEMRHDTCMEKRVCYRDTDGSGANLGGIARGRNRAARGGGSLWGPTVFHDSWRERRLSFRHGQNWTATGSSREYQSPARVSPSRPPPEEDWRLKHFGGTRSRVLAL